ncbi:MAG: aminotransferase class I/II-fold pyridoxal phosphate-dependent enzyme [Spirochaetes bacterium]|nr:aminotransferase class I/II-fold pyridoxal phosphate-dependent enzyme [Spirochaetota bacterium]
MKIDHGGIKNKNFTDFSISINPLTPKFINKYFYKELNYLDRKYNYIEWIENNFQNYFGNYSIITAGATEAFHIIGNNILNNFEIIIPCPNYSEYKKISLFNSTNKLYEINYFNKNDLELETILDKLKKIRKKSKNKIAIIIGNPNNPSGIYKNLFDFLVEIEKYETLTIIDEAFIHFIPDNFYKINEDFKKSLFSNKIKKIDHNNIIYIQTFTKFLGTPGIRVGFVLTKKYSSVFKKHRLLWGIGSSGYLLVEKIIENIDYLDKFRNETCKFLEKEKKKFFRFMFCKSDTNFFIIKLKEKQKFLEILNNNFVNVRDLYNFKLKDFIRIGLKRKDENIILYKILKENKNFICL